MNNLIPQPRSLSMSSGGFTITPATRVSTPPGDEIVSIGRMLAESIRTFTGLELQHEHGSPGQAKNAIVFLPSKDDPPGREGYELTISPEGILLRADQPAGFFYGSQTLLQLLGTPQDSRVCLPALSIRDAPRFPWRGAMLDVSRHFFGVDDVKRYIDLISHYKMNRLHLHLTDDQGWRIEIKAWPNLTAHGSRTQVGGGGGGFYTQEQYKEIVEYARSRYVMVIPEIDTPGHTNAALASYPELNATEEAPDLYEGIQVGFSSLSIHLEITYRFLDDVIRELASLTPGPYIHIGGDEAHSTPKEDYKRFIERFQQIIYSHGKIPIGWAEIGETELNPRTIAQHWQGAAYQGAKQQGCKIILSPADRTYLDMKYDELSPLGLSWVGYTSVKDAYEWEPGTYMEGVEESDLLGIECPLWTETIQTMKDIEFMVFPRLPGLAELAWSPGPQGWEAYKVRLAGHGRHMERLGVNFFKSPDVNWE